MTPPSTPSVVKHTETISIHDSLSEHATPTGVDKECKNDTNHSKDSDSEIHLDDSDDDGCATTLSLCIPRERANPNVTSLALFKGILNSFPEDFSAASDALYWGDEDDNGKATVVKFFGLLDTRGAYGRTKPYFSLGDVRGVLDPRNFKKTKAFFEVRPLPILSEDYPLEACRQSHRFFRGLMKLTDWFEAKRNQNLQKDQIPNVTKMLKENREEDTYTLVIQTEPLFTEPENACAPSRKTLIDMPDPNGLYSKFLAQHPNFSSYEIIPPPIYDANSDIIHPADYNTRLPHLAPVSVVANIRLWEIAPESGRKGGQGNGSRTYQLMMKKLQLLPYIPEEIPKAPEPSKGKGKRRAETPPSDDQGPSLPSTSTKKPRVPRH